jgi:hypothetical protein
MFFYFSGCTEVKECDFLDIDQSDRFVCEGKLFTGVSNIIQMDISR